MLHGQKNIKLWYTVLVIQSKNSEILREVIMVGKGNRYINETYSYKQFNSSHSIKVNKDF